MKKIGFIGTGVMGKAIAQHLLAAGYPLFVYNRTKAKTTELVASGAVWCENPAEVTRQADVVFSMVGYPQDVETIYFGEKGIFKTAKKGQYLIDMTTSTPTLARKIADYGSHQGILVLDAPVSGGDIGAQKGTLTIMIGGAEQAYHDLLPIFKNFGTTIHYFGEAGCGQHTKMANQIMIAGTMTGMTELLVYAKAAKLDLKKVLETVGGGSAANWSLTNYAPRILKEDFTPGFFAKHFLKDLRIALDEAEKMEIQLPATQRAKELYEQLVDEKGLGDLGTQALIKLWWQ